MMVRDDMVKLDTPTKEIHFIKATRVVEAKQDSLGRLYVTFEG